MMTKEKLAELQAEGQDHIAAAKAIAAEHDGDPSSWPPSVLAKYNEHTDAAGKVLERIRTAKDDLAVIELIPERSPFG